MSTKNLFFDNGPDSPKGPVKSPPLLLFLVLSVLVHGLAYFIVLNSSVLEPFFSMSEKSASAPIEVEMVAVPAAKKTEPEKERWTPVIELPSSVKSNAPEKSEVVRYADRTVSVKRESVPKPDSGASLPEASLERTKKAERAGRAQKQETEVQSKSSATKSQRSKTTHMVAEEDTGIKKVSKEAVVVPPYMRSTEEGGAAGNAGTKTAIDKKEATGKGQKPSLFPSGERLTALAKAAPSTAARGAPGPILQLNTTELVYQKYLIYVRDRVSFYWEYPIAAAMNGWQGKLTVDFVIARDGKITEVKIDKGSGYPVLDDAAITAIKLAGPFFTFPEHFVLNSFSVKYQFEYRLTNAPRPVQ